MENKDYKTIRLRCSKTEYDKLVRLSAPYGSFSKLIRESLFSKKRVFIDPKSFLQGMDNLTLSINRVGNNVNQIARFLNTTKDMNDYAIMRQWFDAFEEYKNLLHDVKDEINKFYSL